MVVTIVHARILTVAEAVYLIMGANIGTAVTSLLVAFMQAGNRNVFRRAFAAATLSDTFNWLSVLFLMPLELVTYQAFGMGKILCNSKNFCITVLEIVLILTQKFGKSALS